MPRPGDRYESPVKGGLYKGHRTQQGPFYNVSFTLDWESLQIVNRWAKGTKSEEIRYAIKGRHYGNDPELIKTIERLHRIIEIQQEKLHRFESQNLEVEERSESKFTSIRRFFRNLFTKP